MNLDEVVCGMKECDVCGKDVKEYVSDGERVVCLDCTTLEPKEYMDWRKVV